MNIKNISKYTFLISGVYILLCIPAIFIAEHYHIREAPLHITQFLAVLICTPSCIVYLLMKRKKEMNWIKVLAIPGLILLILWISFLFWFIFGDTIKYFIKQRDFNAEIWRSSKDEYNRCTPRQYMVKNLMSSKKLDGLHRDKVISLLGTPHKKGFPYGAVDCDIHYCLGSDGFLDDEWLFIKLDKDDNVCEYWLYRD